MDHLDTNFSHQNNSDPCVPPSAAGMPNLDPPANFCGTNDPDSLRNQPGVDDFLKDLCEQNKVKLGSHQNCDPMQSGSFINEPGKNPEYIFRYNKSIKATEEAVTDLFNNVIVIDENGQAHKVPIIQGSQEAAVASIVSSNIRQDNSLVVDRIGLPIMAIHQNGIQFAQDRYTYHQAMDYMRSLRADRKPSMFTNEKHSRDTVYAVARGWPMDVTFTLYAWTMYIEDMNQILEQIMLKFSPIAYIKIRGVSWEIGVELNSIGNNIDYEPGDQNARVIKFQFELTAKSYIPQPIRRSKSVLKTKINLVEGVDENHISNILNKLEDTVEELDC